MNQLQNNYSQLLKHMGFTGLFTPGNIGVSNVSPVVKGFLGEGL